MPKISVTARKNRFGNYTDETHEYENFTFEGSLKSFQDDLLFFTNFVKTKNNQSYLLVEKYLKDCNQKNFSFLKKDFSPLLDIKYTEPAAKRLLEIMNKGYNHNFKPKDLQQIFELKHKNQEKFRIFIFNHHQMLQVILIDFFHLGINADKIINGHRKKIHLKDAYNKVKDNHFDLQELSYLIPNQSMIEYQ